MIIVLRGTRIYLFPVRVILGPKELFLLASSDEDDIEELWAKENKTVFLEEEEDHLQSSESFPISDFKIKGPIPGSKIDQLQNSGVSIN